MVTGSTTDHPAHIHDGICPDVNPAPKWPLNDVQNGSSTTELDVSLDQIASSPVAINVHVSPQDETPVACGNIQAAAAQAGGGAAQVPRALPNTGDIGSMAPLATAAGAGLLGLGLALRRRIHR